MAGPLITFDYDVSPYGQKIRLLFAATSVPFHRNDVEVTLPRPTLEKLGVAYRRIPVLAIGKDVYCDTSLIIDVVQRTVAATPLAISPADAAWETLGVSFFTSALNIIPVEALTPEFVKDRKTIFPSLQRPDIGELRPSGLAECRSVFSNLEHNILANSSGPFIGGSKPTLADVHTGWAIRWLLEALGLSKEAGFSETDFPRVHKWCAALPKAQYTDLSPEQAVEQILKAEYTAKPVAIDPNDYTGLKEGEHVKVESGDTEPGAHPQLGKLIGLDQSQIVLEVPTGVHIHFPRRGYILRKA